MGRLVNLIIKKLKNWQKTIIAITYDAAVSYAAILASIYLRFDHWPADIFPASSSVTFLLLIAFSQSFSFYVCGLYKGIWRYSSTPDLLRLIKGISFSLFVSIMVAFFYNRLEVIPRSVFVIDWLLLIVALGGGRLGYRIIRDYFLQRQLDLNSAIRVLVVGAGAAGEQLFREIRKTPSLSMNVVGFIDDDLGMKKKLLHGVPVLGRIDNLQEIVATKKVNKVLIAIPSATGSEIGRIVKSCDDSSIEFKTLPHISDVLNGKISYSQLRDVGPEDLLGRTEIKLDTELIQEVITGSTVLISGAGGSIGSELCRQIAMFNPKEIILYELTELFLYKMEMEIKEEFPNLKYKVVIGDIRDVNKVERVFKECRPDIVFHAAAYKHVPMMEANPLESIHTNIFGTKILSEAASKYCVKRFVQISTDKAVNPTNVMGVTKRVAEMVIQDVQNRSESTKFMTVRFGNVLGSSGSVIPLFKKQILKGGPITVTDPNVERFFMTIPEACQLVMQAGSIGQGKEVFVLDMGKLVKIKDLAKQMITLSGLKEEDIEIKYTGLRPGEKLYEELTLDGEDIIETVHPLVRVVKAQPSPSSLSGHLDSLYSAINCGMNTSEVKDILRVVVPEYELKETV